MRKGEVNGKRDKNERVVNMKRGGKWQEGKNEKGI